MAWGNLPALGKATLIKASEFECKQQINHNLNGNTLIPQPNWRLWVHMQFQYVIMFGNLPPSIDQETLTHHSNRSLWKHSWCKLYSFNSFLHHHRLSFGNKVSSHFILKLLWEYFKLTPSLIFMLMLSFSRC